MNPLLLTLVIGFAGTLGTLVRFALDGYFASNHPLHRHWPWATFWVNAVGSLLIGLAFGWAHSGHLSSGWQLVISTGLAGGLTTFSSWTTATVRLISEKRVVGAVLNVGANLLVGITAAGVGILLGELL
ncbi:fluoride efflux transporter FluC [Pseudarthrobacter sp. J1738]|uniref:fluoride efflux transporter FluC n=1 Tax=Pseudarthrobacter sp. J1738 TaxID=3420446 RepID=UPI003D2851C6